MSGNPREEGAEEMSEWRTILDHVDALYPVFAERGYSRDACLTSWILREIRREFTEESDEDEGEDE